MHQRDEAAKAEYLRRLAENPDDTQTLVDLGNLALRTGFRSAACTAYRRAIAIDPRNPALHVNLGNVFLQTGELQAARAAYDAALALQADFAPAHQGISYVLTREGDEASAQHHRDLGFAGNAILRIPALGNSRARHAIVLVSAAGADFNTDTLLGAHAYDVTKVFAEYATALPEIEHPYALINAIGDADRCRDALLAAQRLCEGRSVLNPPQLVLQTGRLRIADRLREVPGVVTPRVMLLPRTRIADAPFAYPLLIRTPGHHTGRHFVRVETERELDSRLSELPGDELFVSEFIDVRCADGFVRKYRVLGIGGQLYPAHVAIASSWKVHFFTGGAEHSQAQRAQDAAFLTDPRAIVGEAAWRALHAIVAALNLDYMGIDFAIDPAGRLIVFEANAAMSLYAVPADRRWDYRREPTRRIISAFRDLTRR